MKTAQDIIAAALLSKSQEGFEIGPVSFTPSAGNGGNRFATIAVGWTVGPAWGQIRLQFIPMPYCRPGELAGVWRRGNGTAVTPAGFPLTAELSAALAEIAAAGVALADQHLPTGIAPATSA